MFDSKYYNEIKYLDYKQVSYYFLISSRREHHEEEKVYTALILPIEKNNSIINNKKHFMYDKNFRLERKAFNETEREIDSGFVIHECYLDIQEVMRSY